MIVHEVYKNGAADKDGRLQPGDKIVSVNGTAFNDLTHEEALRILRSSHDKVINLFMMCCAGFLYSFTKNK